MMMDAATVELVARARSGDAEAYGRLFERVAERLLRFIRCRLTGRLGAHFDPMDVLQEVYLLAHSHFSSFSTSGDGDFSRWMYTLTNNCLRNNANHFSATKRASPGQLARATGLLDRVRASNTGPVTASIRGEDLEDVYRALEKLTESEREVIVLHYLEQLPVTEVAAIVGLSPSAVRRCLSRCCQKVGSTLDR